MSIFYSLSVFAQTNKVGINTETPQATLHIAGNLRIDSVGRDSLAQYAPLVIDNNGEIKKQDLDTFGIVISMKYGETISAGDIVSIGDGLAGYPVIIQPPFTSVVDVSLNQGTWCGQSFVTSTSATGIRAITIACSSGQTTFTIKLRESVSGLPVGPDLRTITHFQSPNSYGVFTFVFNPPVVVLPSHEYAFIVDFYRPVGINVRFAYTTGNPYPSGMRFQSADSGVTWTSFPTQDLQFGIFETQTIPGYLYKAKVQSGVLSPIATTFYTSTATSYDFSDRASNILGVALTPGTKGTLGRISTGPICPVPITLSPGRSYWLTSTPGSISSGPSTYDKQVGVAVTTNKLLLIH